MKDFLIDMAIVAVVLLIALPFAIKSCEPKVEKVVQLDTIYVYDTIRIVEPVPVKEEVVRYVYVTLPKNEQNESECAEMSSQNEQNEFQEDSVEVIIPITERTYEDSTYRAVVRGYNPELVSLDLYTKAMYYPVFLKQKIEPKIVVSAGIYGGFGWKGADYGFGIMIGVPIWSW
jgi:hypothetical protein